MSSLRFMRQEIERLEDEFDAKVSLLRDKTLDAFDQATSDFRHWEKETDPLFKGIALDQLRRSMVILEEQLERERA